MQKSSKSVSKTSFAITSVLTCITIGLCTSGYTDEPKSREILRKTLPGLLSIGKSGEPHINKELQAELLEMAIEDQEVRSFCMIDQDWGEMVQVDQKHISRLKEIITEFEWPGISLVGAKSRCRS